MFRKIIAILIAILMLCSWGADETEVPVVSEEKTPAVSEEEIP